MKKALVALALVSSLALSACGRVGSAVTMEGSSIPETKVQASIDAILSERGGVDTSQMQLATGAELNRAQVRFYILSSIFEGMAKELKIKVTPTELLTRKQDIYSQIGGESQLPAALVNAQIAQKDFDSYLRVTIISDKLTQGLIASGVAEADAGTKLGELVLKKAQALNIEVNPKYGKWDGNVGDVIESDVAKSAVTTIK